MRDALKHARDTMLALAAGRPVRDLDEQISWIDHLLEQRPEEPRILDEREVRALAKKAGLPKYMDDTETARMALARFAHEVRLDMNNGGAPQVAREAGITSVASPGPGAGPADALPPPQEER